LLVVWWGVSLQSFVVVLVNAHDRYQRQVQSPTCNTGNTQCLLSATDQVNGNQQNSNITKINVDPQSNNALTAVFSYQAANRQNVEITSVSAQAEVTFAQLAEWVDSNLNGVPESNELTNLENIRPNSPFAFHTAYYENPTYIPLTSSLDATANVTIHCYIVQNDTYYVPPDYIYLDGYGAGCHLVFTKSQPIAPSNRLALVLKIDTSLSGGSVDPTLTSFTWSWWTGYQGRQMAVGGAWVLLGTKALVTGSTGGSTLPVAAGAFTPVVGSPTAFTVPLGIVTTGVNSFEFDVGFEPQQIFYQNSATSAAVSLLALFAVLFVGFVL